MIYNWPTTSVRFYVWKTYQICYNNNEFLLISSKTENSKKRLKENKDLKNIYTESVLAQKKNKQKRDRQRFTTERMISYYQK